MAMQRERNARWIKWYWWEVNAWVAEKNRQRCNGFRGARFFEDGWLISPPNVIFKVAGVARWSLHDSIFFSDKLRYLPLKRWEGALENIDARIWRRMSGHYWVTGKMRRAILDGQRAVHWKTCFLSKLGMEIGHSTTCCNFRGDKKLVSQWMTDSSPQLHFPRSTVRKNLWSCAGMTAKIFCRLV